MPRYFFDVRNGETLHRDVDGIDLPSVDCVWQIAVTMVDEIADAGRHLQSPDSISVIVRDASDAVVYRSDHLGRVSAPEADGRAAGRRAAAAATWSRPAPGLCAPAED